MARAESDQSQEPGALPRSPLRVAGAQTLGTSSIAFPEPIAEGLFGRGIARNLTSAYERKPMNEIYLR